MIPLYNDAYMIDRLVQDFELCQRLACSSDVAYSPIGYILTRL